MKWNFNEMTFELNEIAIKQHFSEMKFFMKPNLMK